MLRIRIALSVTLATAFMPLAGAQTIDPYDPLPEGPPTTLARQADGKIVIGGSFLQVNGATYTRLARLNLDGSLDTTFADPAIDSEVKTIAVQPDGKLLIAGGFTSVGGVARHYLARLNDDGTLDTTFVDSNLNGAVWALAVQPDGKVLAGGDFDHIGATAQKYFARFSASGAFDGSFVDPQLCCLPARAIALQSDGHVLIGGYFSSAGGADHGSLARYSSAGAFDASFPNPPGNVPASVLVMQVAPDDSVYVNGSGAIVKLHANGTLDASFTPASIDSSVDGMLLQPDGKLLIGGIFQQVGGQPRHALARLNANGALDSTFADPHFSFDAGNPHGYVYGLTAQADGRVVAIGNFTLANGQPRTYMARIDEAQYATNRLTAQAASGNVTMTWTRAGAGSELVQVPLLQRSSDGVTFTTAATMTRIAGGWRATVSSSGAPFYLRALGTTADGAGNGSRGQVASPLWFNDTIFADGFD